MRLALELIMCVVAYDGFGGSHDHCTDDYNVSIVRRQLYIITRPIVGHMHPNLLLVFVQRLNHKLLWLRPSTLF